MPNSVVIDLVDSTKSYHRPLQRWSTPARPIRPAGKTPTPGVDLPLKTGDPIYATFCGRVRMSTYNNGGYGNLVIIRHDNGLETYYGHLAERLVQAEPMGRSGADHRTGRPRRAARRGPICISRPATTARHSTRTADRLQERMLCRETFLLKKSFFNIHSNAGAGLR